MPPTIREEIPQGTLDLLILKTLDRLGARHGFEIANAIQASSKDVLQVEEGSLYPALQRMLLRDWLSAEWGKTAENRRARYYQLTREGHRQLARELARYGRVSEAIGRVLQPVPQPA
jgi:transcriptional regulator